MKKSTSLILFLLAAALLYFISYESERDHSKYLTNQGVVFGTTYHITYNSPDGKPLSDQIQNALGSIDNSLSMFNPNSTISKINNNEPTGIDPNFMRVWQAATDISRKTNGAFDITVAPLVNLWGFGLTNRTAVTPEQVDSIRQFVGWEKITIDTTYHKQLPYIKLDAGAIAKGYACDVVADTLRHYGCTDLCVEIGGEIHTYGNNSTGKPWRIGINKPIEDSLSIANQIQEVVLLTNKSMATSGNYRNFYTHEGRKISHTIDPRTGSPVAHTLLSATIIADDCITADAWATACMVVGLDEAKRLIEENNLEAYLIYHDGTQNQIWHTHNFPIQE